MLTDKVDLLHLLGNRSTVWLSHFCHMTEQEARLDPESGLHLELQCNWRARQPSCGDRGITLLSYPRAALKGRFHGLCQGPDYAGAHFWVTLTVLGLARP